ncbi:hypothetical protein GMDG_07757 [Pseudogymnoascus destructans 20631-21]|uniref:Uncharacterized protein n=2 Tax=Pseudogymnoascus destructans TaxID=655981 RepID=L8G259_PSED2|nr:hypothetical protein GMDG_07757 [Pseudogymnoascus destructans 20631-21]
MKFSSAFTAGALLFPALISGAPIIDGGIENREDAAAPAPAYVWLASGKKRSPVEEVAEPPTAYVWTAPNKEKRNAAVDADAAVSAYVWTGSNK